MVSDTQTDMLLGEPKSAICVQRFDDSLNSAIHTTYRSWLRSSSMREPRDPPSKVVSLFFRSPGDDALPRSGRTHLLRQKTYVISKTQAGLAERPRSLASDRHLTDLPTPKWFGTVHTVTKTTELFFLWIASVMILPQVHLRKPCYDFYFL